MSSFFTELDTLLQAPSPEQALARLCGELQSQKQYQELFHALLLKARFELGLPTVNVGPNEQLPEAQQEKYEQAIRTAGRQVGQLCLEAGEIGQAWALYRLLNEPAPVAAALEAEQFDPEKLAEVLQIALNEGVHPKKGFDLLVRHHGLCSAITTLSGQFPFSNEVRSHCIRKLVRTMYEELRERLRADIVSREGTAPAADSSIPMLLQGREELTGEDAYHVDVSHLAAVVQFAIELPVGEETRLAAEMCEYGKRLSPRLRYPGAPPFEDSYADLQHYFHALLGQDEDTALEHFRAKAQGAEEGLTAPAEVYVHLLATLDRYDEALQVYTRYLAQTDPRGLACPSPQELCHKLGDFRPLAELSQRRGDWVTYTAALIHQRKMRG